MAARVVWEPSPKQALGMACPAFEFLIWGNRGGGKSDLLLFDFTNDVDKGLGADWRGILIRREYKELLDIIERSKKWFNQIWPDAQFKESASDLRWIFPQGEQLVFRHAKKEDDILSYLGQEWPWQGWEELTAHPNLKLYEDMLSCCRSSNPNVRRRVRINTNPWGPGARAVKARFVDTVREGKILTETIKLGEETFETTRAHMRLDFRDNAAMQKADPGYLARMIPSDPAKRKAWIDGEWSTEMGGFFFGIWDRGIHLIDPFQIPKGWRVNRCHDWGYSSPHDTTWFAEADGQPVEIAPGVKYTFPKGTIFAIQEIYGTAGDKSNWNIGRKETDATIAEDIAAVDRALAKRWGVKVRPGPADNQIFQGAGKKSIADNYRPHGVRFTSADQRPGSRVTGTKRIADMLVAARPFEQGRPMEEPGLFVFRDECPHLARTIGEIQRDEKNPDAYDSEHEDHPIDVLRYRVLEEKRDAKSQELAL